MAEKASLEMRKALAKRSNCSPEVLGKLAKGEDVEVRCEVAANPNCPMVVLAALAKDDDVLGERRTLGSALSGGETPAVSA